MVVSEHGLGGWVLPPALPHSSSCSFLFFKLMLLWVLSCLYENKNNLKASASAWPLPEALNAPGDPARPPPQTHCPRAEASGSAFAAAAMCGQEAPAAAACPWVRGCGTPYALAALARDLCLRWGGDASGFVPPSPEHAALEAAVGHTLKAPASSCPHPQPAPCVPLCHPRASLGPAAPLPAPGPCCSPPLSLLQDLHPHRDPGHQRSPGEGVLPPTSLPPASSSCS